MAVKVYVHTANEDWVVDRIAAEWTAFTSNRTDVETVHDPRDADVIWIMAPWTWYTLPPALLESKKVLCTIHHIDPAKFDDRELALFVKRHQYVDAYHMICALTAQQVSLLQTTLRSMGISSREMFVSPWWVNDTLWRYIERDRARDMLLERHGVDLSGRYVVGSFQRDTEGFDLKTPKLSKGPDTFVRVVETLRTMRKRRRQSDVVVLLGGWRRQYVISELERLGVEYHYLERVPFDDVNVMYNALDLYVVSSRVEGGPQALFEAAITKTPLITTYVGYAGEFFAAVQKRNVVDVPHSPIYTLENDEGEDILDKEVKRALKHIDVEASYDVAYDLRDRYESFARYIGRLVS